MSVIPKRKGAVGKDDNNEEQEEKLEAPDSDGAADDLEDG